MSANRSGVLFWLRSALNSRLARRQVRWVLFAAFVLGMLLSSMQIYWEYNARKTKLSDDLSLLLESVRDSAATAAYQLSAELANTVCNGLVAHPNLQGCSLVLDNEYHLVDTTRSSPSLYLDVARSLFDGPRTRELSLQYRSGVDVGVLRVDINPAAAINDFLISALVVIGIGLVRALVLAIVLFLVFYGLVTRPVLRLSTSIGRIDPKTHDCGLDALEPRQTKDEIRDLELSARQLIQQAQHQFTALERAQRELEDINRSLEFRVEERTQALELAVKKLEFQAQTDPLTKLFNRRQFYREAERYLENWERYGELFGILVLDLDRFKSINDRFGHEMGDRTLESLAGVLKEQCREGDLVARIGGEEFVALIKVMVPEDATRVAERIRVAIAAKKLAGIPDRITVSVGVAWIRSGDSLNNVIKRADLAMYQAKATGRNRVVEEDRSQTYPVE